MLLVFSRALASRIRSKKVALLDEWVVERPQLSPLEFALLAGSVLAAGLGPLFLNLELTELLAPSAAACKLMITYIPNSHKLKKNPILPC